MREPNRKELEALSAHLDDEHPDAEALERALQRDEERAKRAMQYRKLGANLKALPAAEPSPAFRTRLMAQIRETEPARRPSWSRRLIPGAIAVAAVAVLITLVSWPDRTAPPGNDTEWQLSSSDVSELESMLETRFEQASDDELRQYAVIAEANEAWDRVEPPEAELFDKLAIELTHETDIEFLLTSLSDEEETELRSMLLDYAEEELTI